MKVLSGCKGNTHIDKIIQEHDIQNCQIALKLREVCALALIFSRDNDASGCKGVETQLKTKHFKHYAQSKMGQLKESMKVQALLTQAIGSQSASRRNKVKVKGTNAMIEEVDNALHH